MKFIAQIEQLPVILDFVRQAIKDLPRVLQNPIELAVEEAVVNIIFHSKVDDLELDIQIDRRQVKVVIQDRGAAFNPLEHKAADTTSELEEREVGGLGVHFIKQLMDEIHYERIKNTNILTLVKFIHSSQKK